MSLPPAPAPAPAPIPAPPPLPERRTRPERELPRITLSVLFIGALLAAAFWVLQPFIGPGLWAAMVVVATWPWLVALQARLGGRRWAAVALMSLALLLLFVVPLTLGIVTLVANADRIADWVRLVAGYEIPPAPPAWLAGLPFVGDYVLAAWQQLLRLSPGQLLSQLTPYAGSVTRWFVAEVGSIGFLSLQFLFTVLLAAVMWADGERWAATVRGIGRRLGGRRGEGVVVLAGQAIRGVALGVGGTAIVQAVLGGVGVAIAGVPFAGLLTALMFLFSIAQVGPAPVLAAATAWLFWEGSTGWAVFLLVWTLVVGTLDNVVRPLLIRLGADLPLLLIFVGVIGGIFAFGLVGIFVGPLVLAVGFTLLDAWLKDGEAAAAPAQPPLLPPGPAEGAAPAKGDAPPAA